MTEGSSITLHSSWRGILPSYVGATVLFVSGVASSIATGGAVGSLILLAIGGVLFAIVLFDLPIASEFDADGVTRRPLLRRHRIEWSGVDQLTRTRPGLTMAERALVAGGLAAKVGRRRYLLVDRAESLLEFDDLLEVLGDQADRLAGSELIVPDASVAATWANRRKKWIRRT